MSRMNEHIGLYLYPSFLTRSGHIGRADAKQLGKLAVSIVSELTEERLGCTLSSVSYSFARERIGGVSICNGIIIQVTIDEADSSDRVHYECRRVMDEVLDRWAARQKTDDGRLLHPDDEEKGLSFERVNLARQIEAIAARIGEPVEEVVVAREEGLGDVMSWSLGRQRLNIDYDEDWGSSAAVPAFYAYTRGWIIFGKDYDSGLFLCTLPRNPTNRAYVELK